MRGRSGLGVYVLLGAFLAGCGSSATPAPTPTLRPTADLAANAGRQATAQAIANKTSVAVQSLAQTAVARLQQTAKAESRSSQPKPKPTPKGPGPSAPTPTTVPQVAPPTATSTPRPAPTTTKPPATKPTRAPTKSPPRPALIVLASVSCCSATEFKGAAERTSHAFSVNGGWLLRWSTTCSNVGTDGNPAIYIALIPIGTGAPIQLIQEPMPVTSSPGLAREALRGRYYLDVLSPCSTFQVAAYGRRGVQISQSTQSSMVAEAERRPNRQLLAAIRARLLPRKPVTQPATSRAATRVRLAYVSALSPILARSTSAATILINAASAIDPTSADFDPSALRASRRAAVNAAATLSLQAVHLQPVKTIPKHRGLKTLLARTVNDLQSASGLIIQAADEVKAGDSTTASSDLNTAESQITAAQDQLAHIARNLAKLKSGQWH